ncbi:52 kDa repressor of the inhibitor of the protein kinase-like, partial [Aphis craccivora]
PDRLCHRQCDIDVEKLLKLNITCCCYNCGWTRTTVVDGCSLYLWYVECATIMAVDKTDNSSQKIRDIVAVSDSNEPVDVSQTAIPRAIPQLNVICDVNKQNNITSDLVFDNDIGNFIGKKLDDYTKCRLLENPWKPLKNFENNHFDQYPWLIYSVSKSGCVCKYCTLFLTHNKDGRQNTEELKKLVILPLSQYSKLLGKDGYLEKHNQNHYHQDAILKSSDFLKTYNSPNKQVNNILNSERLRQVQENRNRGHRDSEQIIFHDTEDSKNLTDPTYSIEKNEDEVNTNQFYSIIFDETTDVSHISQMSLTLRYIDKKNNIYELFVGFINCHDTFNKNQTAIPNNDLSDTLIDDHLFKEPKLTGNVLGNIVVSELKEMSLNLKNCIGIGTDGCSVMTSVLRGAVQEVQKSCPNAIYSWVEHHTSIIDFEINMSEIVESLTHISQWTDQVSSSKANSLLLGLCNFEFIITLYILSNILSITLPASKMLQGVNLDVNAASSCITTNIINKFSFDVKKMIDTVIEHFIFLDININILKGEIDLWKSNWISGKNEGLKIPEDVLESIDECHPVMFLTIRQVLVVLATLPVSIASAERSFSTLRSSNFASPPGRRAEYAPTQFD